MAVIDPPAAAPTPVRRKVHNGLRRPGDALAGLGWQLSFYLRALALAPLTLRRYPRETARLLTEASGREITYYAETDEEARASRAGAEEWQIAGWAGSYKAVATGETSVTSHTVEHVTGRPPWTFEEFLHHEPEAWRHLIP